MQERQVTVEGTTFTLAAPFHVLATANPVEYEGTYPLPEAQLDRFLLRRLVRLPNGGRGVGRAQRRIGAAMRSRTSEPVTDAAGCCVMQQACEAVTVDATVGRYCVELAAATRRHRQVLIGASPRGSLALLLTARAYAVISGRDFVVPEDVKAVAPRHWPIASRCGRSSGSTTSTAASVVRDVLSSVPAPPTVRPAPTSP